MVDPPPTKPRRTRRWWIAWSVVFLACGGLAAADVLVNLDRVGRQRAWQNARVEHARRTHAVRRAVRDRIDAARGQTFETLEGPWQLSTVRKVALGSSAVRYAVPGETFGSEAKGYLAVLYFEGDVFTGYSVTPPAGPPQPAFALYLWFHRAVMALALVFFGAWLTFFLAPLREKSRAAAFGEAALGATFLALTAGVIWRLGPFGQNRVVGPAMAPVGFTMLVASSIVFVRGLRHRRRADHSRCAKCSYDLTGNESGVCPECGTPTLAGLRRRDEEEAAFVRALEERDTGAPPAAVSS